MKKKQRVYFIILFLFFIFLSNSVKMQEKWGHRNWIKAYLYSAEKIEIIHGTGFLKGIMEPTAVLYPDPFEGLTIFRIHVGNKKDGWLPIVLSGSNDISGYTFPDGWVNVGNVKVGIQNYDNKEVAIFENPSGKNQINAIYNSQIATVLDVNGDWAYLEVIDSAGNKLRGWIDPKWYCDNPYSTCP